MAAFFFFKVCESKLALGPMGTGQVGGRAGQNCRDKVVTGLGGGQEHKQNKQHKQQISPGQRLEGMGRRELQLGGWGGKRRRLESALNPAGRVASGAGDGRPEGTGGFSCLPEVSLPGGGESHTHCAGKGPRCPGPAWMNPNSREQVLVSDGINVFRVLWGDKSSHSSVPIPF